MYVQRNNYLIQDIVISNLVFKCCYPPPHTFFILLNQGSKNSCMSPDRNENPEHLMSIPKKFIIKKINYFYAF